MRKLHIKYASVSELENALKAEKDPKITLRLFCILSIAKSASSREAQKHLLLSHNQICKWVNRFNESGIEGLKDKPKSGRKPKITDEQLIWLKNVVLTESPTKYGFNTETWTAPLLAEILESNCGIKYSNDMIYVLLKKKGLTYKKAKGTYPEANKEDRKAFVELIINKILGSSKNDVFLFEDECSMINTANTSYKWSERGVQPIVEQKQKTRERVTLFGAVNPASGEVIAQQAESGNSKTFLNFIKKIVKTYDGRTEKIHLVLDNVPYHHGKLLKPYLEKNKDKIELIFLPAYSPDFNPIERVWWYMRKKITNNRYVDSMKNRMIAFWKMFSHFQKPNQEIVDLCNLSFSA